MYTRTWRTPEAGAKLPRAINHLHRIMKPESSISVKIGSKYYGPCWGYCRPFMPFSVEGA